MGYAKELEMVTDKNREIELDKYYMKPLPCMSKIDEAPNELKPQLVIVLAFVLGTLIGSCVTYFGMLQILR